METGVSIIIIIIIKSKSLTVETGIITQRLCAVAT